MIHKLQPTVTHYRTIQSLADESELCRFVQTWPNIKRMKVELHDVPTLEDCTHVSVGTETQDTDTRADCQYVLFGGPHHVAHFGRTTDLTQQPTALCRDVDKRHGVEPYNRPTSPYRSRKWCWTPELAFPP